MTVNTEDALKLAKEVREAVNTHQDKWSLKMVDTLGMLRSLASTVEVLAVDRDHWKHARQITLEGGEILKARAEKAEAQVAMLRKAITGYLEHPARPDHHTAWHLKDALAKLEEASP